MAQPLFALANRTGALPQVYRIAGASPQVLGDPLPTGIVESGTDLERAFPTNRVIQFGGDVYAVAVNGVYKKDDPTIDTGTWTQDHAFTGVATAGENFHIRGVYQIVLNGVSSLFVVWPTTTASTWNASILNGTTDVWSDVGAQVGLSHLTSDRWGKQIVYRGVLYMIATDSTGIMTFDPGAQSFGTISSGTTSIIPRFGICVFNDRLFILGRNGLTGTIALYEITGGGVVHLFDTSFDDGVGAGENDARYALCPSPDGSVMYAVCITSTGGTGTVFLKFIDTSGTISYSTDLTNAVLPAGLRPGGGSTDVTNRWWCFYDQETTPGASRLLLFRAVSGVAGQIVTQYVFNDEISELTQEDAGGDTAWAFSNVTTGGGERIFTPGEMNIEIVSRLAVLGGEAVRFKCWGATGADKNVNFRLNTQTEVPLTLATLSGTPTVVSGPAPVPTRNVNTLEGVTADGTTIYQTVWDIATDGLVSGQRAQLVPRIFV